MLEPSFQIYVQDEMNALFDWAKCGESVLSAIPTVLWTVGMAALAHRLLSSLFHRFLFRRVPVWEVILQHLLFLWMVIYSVHCWVILVQVIKFLVDYFYVDIFFQDPFTDSENSKLLQQWIIWISGVMPLTYFYYTRPRQNHMPLMIWITTSPWQRREMGPYGYYLHRPLTPLHSSTNISIARRARITRRAYSDYNIVKEPIKKKKRYSKSV